MKRRHTNIKACTLHRDTAVPEPQTHARGCGKTDQAEPTSLTVVSSSISGKRAPSHIHSNISRVQTGNQPRPGRDACATRGYRGGWEIESVSPVDQGATSPNRPKSLQVTPINRSAATPEILPMYVCQKHIVRNSLPFAGVKKTELLLQRHRMGARIVAAPDSPSRGERPGRTPP